MVGTDTLLNNASSEQTRASLQHLLDQQSAQQQLSAMGVDPAWAKERASRLTDAELARINQGIDQMNAGGDSVLGILLLIFIIFIITDAIGATDIFPFVHPVR
jgi:cob(I)alamin adenosyltransferase